MTDTDTDADSATPMNAASLDGAELELYKAAFQKTETVCLEASQGNLEARIIGIEEFGDAAGMLNAINRLLDRTDAFIREAGISLEYASEGKYFRRFLERGMLGDFRRGAETINTARETMEAKAKAAADAEAEAEAQREREREQAEASAERLRTAEEFCATVSGVVETVAHAANDMEKTAGEMSSLAESTHKQSLGVAAAAEQTTTNVQTVAAATEQLSASINEISSQVSDSTTATRGAIDSMNGVNKAIDSLAEAAEQIEKVVVFIRGIANQTHMLALNATIEAARAGDAGKGFSVVASEVKSLADQTANATNDIATQIEGIQSASRRTVDAARGIGSSIEQVDQIATTIASAVEKQSVATREISGSVAQAAEGTRDVSGKVSSISGASEETGTAAKDVLSSAGKVTEQARVLSEEVENFLARFRAA